MLLLDAQQVAVNLDYPSLIVALATAFRSGFEAPQRHHHTIPVPGGADATLLLMPAWLPGQFVGTKITQVFPGNGAIGLPSVQSIYLLFDGRTGQLLATLNGSELTTRRTVAASSLAVRYLARPEASQLLIVGTGQVAAQLASSHAAVRPIRIQHHSHRALTELGRKLVRRLAHKGSTFSGVGASDKVSGAAVTGSTG